MSRQLNLSQTVTLCVMTAGDAMERAKILRRFIEMCVLLQSRSYGNIYSFVAIMQGIAAPQVKLLDVRIIAGCVGTCCCSILQKY